ncbi:T9SS type A sorting domain-containing protein, partial [candidate division GN15 bacterium]|nr:T9SS type A sorting domain-containing protein [candidate division GN15 bacterium]
LGLTIEDMIRVGDEVWIGGAFDKIADVPSSDLAVLQLQPDSLVASRLQFTSEPAEDTVLNYGEVFYIDWAFSDSVFRPVTLEVSLDSGLTWTEIQTSLVASTPLEYGRWWLVPDTNAEFCQFRVADSYLPCVNTTGNFFAVQTDPGLSVEWLTKGAPGAPHPRPFVPDHDSWGFDNIEYFMWPEAAWRDIDYSGFAFEPDQDAFPSWETYCDAFGEDWCYVSEPGAIGVPDFADPVAYTEWRILSKDWNGSCFGMALGALRVFAGLSIGFLTNPQAPQLDPAWLPRTEYNPDSDSLNQINFAVRNTLNRWHCYQYTAEHAFIAASRSGVLEIVLPTDGLSDEPMTTLQTIRDDWNALGGALNARTLTMLDLDDLWRAHAVVPYKIVNHQDSSNVYQLFVYDPNENGGDTLHVRIDSTLNTWEYTYQIIQRDDSGNVIDTLDRGWDPSHKGLFVTKHVSDYGNTALDKSSETSSRAIAATRNDTTALFAMARVRPEYDILFVSDSGDTTGYLDSTVIWQAKNTMPVYPLNSLYDGGYPISYLMPDSARAITISSPLDTTIRFGWTTDVSAYAYERFDASAADTDQLGIDSLLTAFNPGAASRTIQLDAAVHDSLSGKLIRISQVTMAPADSLSLGMDSAGTVTIDNPGTMKSVDILLWGTDATNGDQFAEAGSVMIEADARYTVGLDWVALGGGQQMDLDRGRDGSVDEIVPLNALTGIDDEFTGGNLPAGFELAQNYPNPFNPTTRIDFSLPARADVTLVVYNILGQQVRTLVDKDLAAGDYSIEWDGTGDRGEAVATGIYLYRLTAGDEQATRKMLLLK